MIHEVGQGAVVRGRSFDVGSVLMATGVRVLFNCSWFSNPGHSKAKVTE